MADFDPFADGVIERTASSTEAQREIWLVARFGGEQASLAYNESVSLLLNGQLNVSVLHAAINCLISRHESLRSTFSQDGLTLIVNAESSATLATQDLCALPQIDQLTQCVAAREAETKQAFDLVKGPLIRFRLLHMAEDRHELILTTHHIICDGWSLGVLIRELADIYAAGGTPASGMPAAPSFVDHAIMDRESLHGTKADATELYWAESLGVQPPELDLPTDRPRAHAIIEVEGVPTRDLAATRIERELGVEIAEAAKSIARLSGAGLPATLLSVFAILLRKLTGQEDFIIGVPAAAQAYTGEHGLVGHCVQMLPIRIHCQGQICVTELAKAIKTSLLDGFENQKLTFGALLQRLRIQRDPFRIPLIPVMFNLDQEFNNLSLGACDMEVISNPRFAENFEVFLNITPQQGRLKLETTFRTGIFENSTICEWLECYEAALAHIVTQPEICIDDVVCISQRQQNLQLDTWNTPPISHGPAGNTVSKRIAAMAAQQPNRIAVQDHQESVSYHDLLQRASRIAGVLIAAGVAPGSHVGICRTPGVGLVAGLLGIWKAGCAYIPLDPEYPETRLRFVLQDTDAVLILGEGDKPDFAANCYWLTEDGSENLSIDVTELEPQSTDLAYIIHTSGSTGQPKGVMVEHAALDNLMVAMAERPGINQDSVLLAVTTLSFDISALEIFLPLTTGGKVVLASREQAQDSFELIRLLRNCGANYMQATPSGWRSLLDAGWDGDKNLKALCGGEELTLSLAQELAPRVGSLWNMYGPTEATIWSTVECISENTNDVTLGQPIANTSALVLDEHLRLLPPGAAGGELFLGGAGLARGYLNQPELTAERFIPNPFAESLDVYLYRTGDRVRLDTAGRLQFLGRKDNQAKIRGYRIEMGEIENTLCKAAGVSAAVAVVHTIDNADSRLVAYVTLASSGGSDTSELSAFVQQELPSQCVPQHIVLLEDFPRTANGKIDRKSLPNPFTAIPERATELTTDTQRKLGTIWCELLRYSVIGPQDDFFLLGGHSLMAIRMLSQIREVFGLELPLQTIFRDRSIANLSARINLLQMQRDSSYSPSDENTEVFKF